MEVVFRKPEERFTWLVKQYEQIIAIESSDVLEKFIPREDVSLVFHFGTSPYLLEPQRGYLPSFFLAPVVSNCKLMQINDSNLSFIVTCIPSVLSRVFKIDIHADNKIYVELPDNPFFELWRELSSMDSFKDKINCFQMFLETQVVEQYTPDDIDVFYKTIIDPETDKSVSEIESEFTVSPRTIQRQFIKRVGVSPKKLERITRLNRVWESISGRDIIDYQNLIYKGKYYDQSHFIKDFKEITGETPDKFFRRDLSNVRIMSGKECEQ